MEKQRITTGQTSGEQRGGLDAPFNFRNIFLIGGVLITLLTCALKIQDNEKKIVALEATVINLHTQQHEINSQLTEGFRESVKTITAEIDANQERDSLQTKAIELLNKIANK